MRSIVPAAVLCLLALAGCDGSRATGGHAARPAQRVRPVSVRPFGFEPDAVLLLTGGNHGRLEMCNCGGVMPGGLTRRGGLLASYRAAFPSTLAIDLGDLFWIEPDPVREEFLFRGLDMLGYDAVVPGDTEWSTPPAQLRQSLAGKSLPLLSTNVRLRDGSVPAEPVLRRQCGGCDLAVLAYVGEEAFRFAPAEAKARLQRDSDEAFARRVAELKAAGCTVVVLVHDDLEQAEALARAVPAIDVIVRGHTSGTDSVLDGSGPVPITRIGGPDVVGALALQRRDDGRLQAAWRVELLNEDWPADLRMQDLYQAYTHAAMRQAMDAHRAEGLRYASSETCGRCHATELAAWRRTDHAHAWQTLVDAGRPGDPECLMCHTSGFRTEHGFTAPAQTPQLSNVNCQDCHRFDVDEHVSGGRRVEGFLAPTIGEDLCRSCHTTVNSRDFHYESYRGRIVVAGHGRP